MAEAIIIYHPHPWETYLAGRLMDRDQFNAEVHRRNLLFVVSSVGRLRVRTRSL